MKKVYVVKKLWFDILENRNSYGYTPEFIVATKEQAEWYVNLPKVPKDKHYAFLNDMPQYTYEELWFVEEEKFEFMECDTCRSKPGSPYLCDGCLNNRRVIERLKTMLGRGD